MKSVEHINSSGLGILIASLNAVRQAAGDLKIANASSTCSRLAEDYEAQPNLRILQIC